MPESETTETETVVKELERDTPAPTPPPARPAPLSPSTLSEQNTDLLKELIRLSDLQRSTVETLMGRVDSVCKYLMQVTEEMRDTMESERQVMELSEKVLVDNDQVTEKLGLAVKAITEAEMRLTALYQAAANDEQLPEAEPDEQQ